MNISVITGSRADYGLLEWPLKLLREDPFFAVAEVRIWDHTPAQALQAVGQYLDEARPHVMLVLGDRFEIMAAAMAAHLRRIPIAHIGGGDVTEGSYDDAMRDCISRMAMLHLVTSKDAERNLWDLSGQAGRFKNIFLVGNPAIDYIRNADWQKPPTHTAPYVVVSYQAETIDGTVDLDAVNKAIAGRNAIWIKPNPDAGNEKIFAVNSYSHADFLNLLVYCDEFIGNSSAMLYEALELGVKCTMIGKRQRGRAMPWGDGKASERIRDILKNASL